MAEIDLHTHTRYSDGFDTPNDMAMAASKLGIRLLGFSDHVRATTVWIDDYIMELGTIAKDFSTELRIMCGLETKIIDLDGNLDIAATFDSKVDYMIGSFHRIPCRNGFMSTDEIKSNPKHAYENWKDALLSYLRNPIGLVVGHIDRILTENGITIDLDDSEVIAEEIMKSKKLVELDPMRGCPQNILLSELRNLRMKFILSSDSHSISELRKFHETVVIPKDDLLSISEIISHLSD